MIAVVVTTMAACGGKTNDANKDMNKLTFNEGQASSMVAIASVKGQPQVASPSAFPLGQPNDAYTKYFIGQSYLAVLDTVSGLCNVTFEPGCRNNWHEPVDDEQYNKCK